MSEQELNDLHGLDDHTILCMTYKEVQELKSELKTNYVPKEAFSPVKRCCYAIAGGFFLATLSGIVAVVLK